jgi:tetratricopeptide (TPR) repeat protein
MVASMTYGSLRIARRTAAVAALSVLALAASGCSKLKARDLLNKGVAAFKNGQSDVAIEDFKQAKEADPDLLNARLYLATAYASLYIPGAPSAENQARGQQAVAEFKEVLDKNADNLSAIDGIGSILFQMAGQPFDPKKFEESKSYHQRHILNLTTGSGLSIGRWRFELTAKCAWTTTRTTSRSR